MSAGSKYPHNTHVSPLRIVNTTHMVTHKTKEFMEHTTNCEKHIVSLRAGWDVNSCKSLCDKVEDEIVWL